MTRRPHVDLSLFAIVILLAVQASIASYGVRLVRDVAVQTHGELVAVARSAAR